VAELEAASVSAGRQGGRAAVDDLHRFGLEYFEHPRERGRAALKQVRRPSQRDERPGEHAEVQCEREIAPHADLVANEHAAAHGDRHGSTEACEQREAGAHEAVQLGERHVGVQILLAQGVPAGHFGGFLPIGAHHANAGEVFLRARAETAELLLGAFETRVDETAEAQHEERQPDHGEQRRRGERGRNAQHHREGEQSAEYRVGEVHEGRTRRHAHRTQVVGESRHQITGTPARIPRGIEPCEAGEDVAAQVGFDAPAHAVERLPHGEPQHARDGGGDDHHQAQP